MNDKELIEELRGYATALRVGVHVPHTGADLIERGADALAARQPTEDDREALRKEFEYRIRSAVAYGAGKGYRERPTQERADWIQHAVRGAVDRMASAAVPDVATDARDHLHAKCDCVPDLGPAHCHMCGNAKGSPVPWSECSALELACKLCDGIGLIGPNHMNSSECEVYARLRRAEAERDAALAAVGGVRALLSRKSTAGSGFYLNPDRTELDMLRDLYDDGFANELVVALDGAPEPEVKP